MPTPNDNPLAKPPTPRGIGAAVRSAKEQLLAASAALSRLSAELDRIEASRQSALSAIEEMDEAASR
jgi:hypothetical protein